MQLRSSNSTCNMGPTSWQTELEELRSGSTDSPQEHLTSKCALHFLSVLGGGGKPGTFISTESLQYPLPRQIRNEAGIVRNYSLWQPALSPRSLAEGTCGAPRGKASGAPLAADEVCTGRSGQWALKGKSGLNYGQPWMSVWASLSGQRWVVAEIWAEGQMDQGYVKDRHT